LDDPGWSLPSIPTRQMELDHVQSTTMPGSELLFYEYGSVLAEFGWDLRLLSTPPEVMRYAMDAVSEMGQLPQGQEFSAPAWMASFMLTRFVEDHPESHDEACAQFGERFPLEDTPDVCSP
jgi:hypothetical protein